MGTAVAPIYNVVESKYDQVNSIRVKNASEVAALQKKIQFSIIEMK